MTRRQWTKVGELFTKAAGLEPAHRQAYLKKATQDPEIRREVEKLLAQHDKHENILGVYSSLGGKVLSHYKVGPTIGSGGLGLIYKARDIRLNRWVALKVLHPWAMGHSGFRERLIKEAQSTSVLNHPNIVTIYEVGHENEVHFIAMEYVIGKTLDLVIPPKGLPVRAALQYAFQMADALSAAQAVGILHGDLKPLNIMVTERGQVKLLDFGLAQALAGGKGESQEPLPSERFGTKPYMAPERLANLQLDPDPHSEIFSFGLILHEMLSGRHAFHVPDTGAIPIAIQSKFPKALPAKVPTALAKVVRRCLDKNPKKRFESMGDLFYALKKCGGRKGYSEGVLTQSPSRTVKAPRTAGRSDSAEMRRVRAALGRLAYQNVARSRDALVELSRVIQDSPSPASRKAVAVGLKSLILSADFGSPVPPPPVRQLRQVILEVMKTASQGKLGEYFKASDLEHLDLFGMDFSRAELQGMSFKGCFLVEASFERCQLARTSFAGAYIRNVNFEEADLSGVDLTDADWFNALNLTQRQLQSVRQETLLDCPCDVRALHRHLKNRYGFPFGSWGVKVQEELQKAWKKYLARGGLRAALLKIR